MKITLGMLAWNEAGTIGGTIASIFEQTLITSAEKKGTQVEILCIPNGCTDATPALAEAALRRCHRENPSAVVSWRVIELKEPGKTNAWMRLMHEFSDPCADFVIMVDADIQFLDPDALLSLVDGLTTHPAALVASGVPVKDLALKPRKTLFDRLSVSATEMTRTVSFTYIVGMLYCARGDFIRRIHMPRGMIGEDAFLMRMTVTNLFTSAPAFNRVIHPKQARFLFEAYKNPGVLFRQHKRRAVTRIINKILFDYLEKNRGAGDAGQLIEKNNSENPLWYQELIQKEVQGRGRWVVGLDFLSNRVFQIKRLGFRRAIPNLPAAIIGGIEDIFVYAAANRALKNGKIASLWADVRKSGDSDSGGNEKEAHMPTLEERH
jgi:glycosyltransferase involved in cell wall biosynthesis